MHLLATTSASLEDLAEPVDLGQTPAEMVALSFTDSDLSGLAAAWKAEAGALPSMRLAALRDLAIPMSVDLWVDRVAAMRRSSWCASSAATTGGAMAATGLSAMARERGIELALLPGECRDRDERLIAHSTLPRRKLEALLGYFREGGPANMRALVRRLARLAGSSAAEPRRGRSTIGAEWRRPSYDAGDGRRW